MATITTLGFTIFSRYNGDGVRRARRDVNDLEKNLNNASKGLNTYTGRLTTLTTAAVALGPALVPIGTAAVGVAAAVAGMGTAAGAAGGIFAGAMKGAVQRIADLQKAQQGLNPIQKIFVENLTQASDAYNKFLDATQDKTLMVAIDVLAGVRDGFAKLPPVIDAVFPSMKRASQALQDWLRGDGLDRFINTIIKYGVPALDKLMLAGRDVLTFLGEGFRAFAPLGVKVADVLAKGAAALAKWAQGGGFQRFADNLVKNGPKMGQFLDDLWKAIKNLSVAFAGMSGFSFTTIGIFLKIVGNLPPGVIQAMAYAWIAWKVALIAWQIAAGGAAIAAIALETATSPFLLLIVGAAVTILGVVAALVALGVGIYFLVKNWDTVSSALVASWNWVWNGIKAVAQTVWGWLQTAWAVVGAAFLTAWNVAWGAVKVAFDVVWGGIKVAAGAVWGWMQAAWGAIWPVMLAAWNAFAGPVKAAWDKIWPEMKAAAENVWKYLQIAWAVVWAVMTTVWNTFASIFTTSFSATWTAISAVSQGVWTAMQVAWSLVWSAITTVWNLFVAVFTPIFTATWTTITAAAQMVWNIMVLAWNVIWTVITAVWNTFAAVFMAVFSAAWTGIVGVATAIWNLLVAAWNAVWAIITAVFLTIFAIFTGHWSTAWNAIKDAAIAVWEVIKAYFNILVQYFLMAWNMFAAAFTALWNAGWNGIKAVALAVWSALQGAFAAVWTFIRTYATAWWGQMQALFTAGWNLLKAGWNAAWGWVQSVVVGVWTFIRTYATAWWAQVQALFTAALSIIKAAWNAAWGWVQSVVTGIWTFIRTYATAWWAQVEALFNAALAIVKAAWNAAWTWVQSVVTTIWTFIRTYATAWWEQVKALFNAALEFVKSIWSAAWNWIQNAATAVWTFLRTYATSWWDQIRGLFQAGSDWLLNTFWNPVKNFFTKTIPDAFSSAVTAIGKAWDSIKKTVRDPIQAVVDVVYNKGIVAVWNLVADAFGAPKLKSFDLPNFREGGPVRGAGSSTSDSINARLSAGEHVWTAREVRAAGGHHAVAKMRSQAVGGTYSARVLGGSAFAQGGGVSRDTVLKYPGVYEADGEVRVGESQFAALTAAQQAAFRSIGGHVMGKGVLDTIVDTVTGGLSKLAGLVLGSIAPVANPLIDAAANAGKTAVKNMIPGTPVLETAAVGMIDKIAKTVKDWITNNDFDPTMMGGGNVDAAMKWADSQIGKPYQLGGTGSPGWDCSSFMSAIAKVIVGQKPGPWFTTHPFHGGAKAPVAGWERDLKAPFRIGVTDAGIGHMGGTLNGTEYEATPPALRKGSAARGADDPMFKWRYGFKPSIASLGPIPTGQRASIITAALKAAGVPPPGTMDQWLAGMNTLIQRESNWNASAINRTDSNAAAGHPSQGLAQVIPSTFAENHVAGTSNNILDPVANVAAAIRYIVRRYGNITNVQQANPNLPPKGYRFGGPVMLANGGGIGDPLPGAKLGQVRAARYYALGTSGALAGWSVVGEHGPEMVKFRGGETVKSNADSRDFIARHGGHGEITVTVPIEVHGNMDSDTYDRVERELLPKLRMMLQQQIGRR